MIKKDKKIIILGLDCATPKTIFEDFLNNCPNIKKLMKNGVYGKLKSTDPPITIPAWMSMATSKNPGKLGVYGFRRRINHSYDDFTIVNSNNIKETKIWDILGNLGLKSCIIGVPPSYPVKPINGYMISGFMAPDTSSEYTYPSKLKHEIKEKVGDYILDITYRTDAKEQILKDLYKMTQIQFKTVKYLIKNKDWNFFQFVFIGLDRIHHAFWKYYDRSHLKYEPDTKFEDEFRKYYAYLDKKIGGILKLLDDDTIVMIVSDHGAKAMKGCISVNMALESMGLLKFKNGMKPGTKIKESNIDWSKTYAWGWGGYEARIFLNVEGREKFGIIKKENYDKMRNSIAKKLKQIKDNEGRSMNNIILKPEEIYSDIRGEQADLIIYFDNLNWRSVGTVGYDNIYLFENDTGPDDAVHDHNGIFIIYDPMIKIGKDLGTRSILDITPTCLNILGIEIPHDMEGKIIELKRNS